MLTSNIFQSSKWKWKKSWSLTLSRFPGRWKLFHPALAQIVLLLTACWVFWLNFSKLSRCCCRLVSMTYFNTFSYKWCLCWPCLCVCVCLCWLASVHTSRIFFAHALNASRERTPWARGGAVFSLSEARGAAVKREPGCVYVCVCVCTGMETTINYGCCVTESADKESWEHDRQFL